MPHYTSAQAILSRLREAGLIDSQGVRILPTALTSSPRTEETQGVSYCRSHFADADIEAYFINIHYTEVHDLQASINRLNALPHDNDTLVGLAAPSWSLTITRGRMDSDIPGNITNLVLHALGEGEVVWSERIPEAEWFTARFTHADEILSQLDSRNCGVHRSRLDDASRLQGADQYIHECIEADDGTFAMGTLDVLTRAGKPTQLRLNVFVEDQLADDLTFFFASYFPATTPSRELAENGWLIQVLPDPAGVASREDLDDAVQLLRSALLPPAQSASQELEAWFTSMNLLPPTIPTPQLEQELRQQHPRLWATQAKPSGTEDYLMRSADYLRGAVPDQFAVGHAGHGANSYALSIRAAVGPVALLLQCAWGGVYLDTAAARVRWHDLRSIYEELVARIGTPEPSDAHQRDILVTFSDFRDRVWSVERLSDGSGDISTYDSGAAMLAAHFPLR